MLARERLIFSKRLKQPIEELRRKAKKAYTRKFFTQEDIDYGIAWGSRLRELFGELPESR